MYKNVGKNVWVVSNKKIKQLMKNNNITIMVSYPRSGSHMIRIILEQYTNRPLIPRTFLHYDKSNPILCHFHYYFENYSNERIIFLYRNPVDVVFSHIVFDKNEINIKNVNIYVEKYIEHFKYWMIKNTEKNIFIIKFENFLKNSEKIFIDILKYIDENIIYDEEKFQNIYKKTNKKYISELTNDIPLLKNRVICQDENYENKREEFKNNFKNYIFDLMEKNKLLTYFQGE